MSRDSRIVQKNSGLLLLLHAHFLMPKIPSSKLHSICFKLWFCQSSSNHWKTNTKLSSTVYMGVSQTVVNRPQEFSCMCIPHILYFYFWNHKIVLWVIKLKFFLPWYLASISLEGSEFFFFFFKGFFCYVLQVWKHRAVCQDPRMVWWQVLLEGRGMSQGEQHWCQDEEESKERQISLL